MTAITEQTLRTKAEQMGLFYSQYWGHFDGWTVATVTKDMHFKQWHYGTSSALLIKAGDKVLVKPDSTYLFSSGYGTTIAYVDRSEGLDFLRVAEVYESSIGLEKEAA